MINFFINNFSKYIWLAIIIISLIPSLEGRIAIPFGIAFSNYSIYLIFLLSWLGSIIPAFIIIPFFNYLNKKHINISFLSKFLKKENISKFQQKDSINNKELLLCMFVALPLPLTGVWSGSLLASLLNLPTIKSLISISIGAFIALLIITLISYVFKASIFYYLIASLILIVMFIFIKLICYFKKKK